MSKLFPEIHGHQKLIKQLSKLYEEEQIPQALLIIGPDEIGKFTIAKQLANLLNPQILDQHILEGKTSIKIEEIRTLINTLSLTPQNKYRIVIIKNCERLTKEAANALLKSLEEPATFTKFILTSSQELIIPETIRSRCQLLHTTHLTTQELKDFKSDKLEEYTLSDTDLLLSMKRPGRLYRLVMDINYHNKNQETLQQLSDILATKDLKKALLLNKNISLEKENISLFLEILISYLRFSDNKNKNSYWATHTKLTEVAKLEISQNQNPNLVLDKLFIDFFST